MVNHSIGLITKDYMCAFSFLMRIFSSLMHMLKLLANTIKHFRMDILLNHKPMIDSMPAHRFTRSPMSGPAQVVNFRLLVLISIKAPEWIT